MGALEDITGKAVRVFKVGITDDTAIHQLNRLYCVLVLIILTILVSAKQYVGEPISCWCPAEFQKTWVAYTNTYCWIKNTYYVPFDTTIPEKYEEREDNEVLYYQWVPLIFAFQALFFFLPRMVWKHFCGFSGLNIKNVLNMANDATYMSPKNRKEQMEYMASYMDKWIEIRDCDTSRHRRVAAIKDKLRGRGLHNGNFLAFLFTFVGILYATNSLAQIFVVDSFMGNDFRRLGYDFFYTLARKEKWQFLSRFPRIAFCDFDIRQLNNVQRWTVQCSLPINLFNEKIFTVLWFILYIMTAINFINLIFNTVMFFVPNRKNEYVKKYLTLGSVPQYTHARKPQEVANMFVDDYLKHDGVFIIYLLAHNVSPVIAMEAVEALWEQYCQKQHINRFLNDIEDGIN